MTSSTSHVMVDGHVHLHKNFSLSRLFLISLQNFRKIFQQFNLSGEFDPVLLLSESGGADQFAHLCSLIGKEDERDYQVMATGEPFSVRITSAGGQHLTVVAGRQIITAERIEVLALGYRGIYPDNRPLLYVLQDLGKSGCLLVLPWGTGKWLGRRGKVVQELIASWSGEPFFLGDNGNRPWFWSLPDTFNRARAHNYYNLPGSDPLPFPGEEKKVGSCGFLLRGDLNQDAPFHSLRSLLLSGPDLAIPFVSLEKLVPFIRHQVAMQLGKKNR